MLVINDTSQDWKKLYYYSNILSDACKMQPYTRSGFVRVFTLKNAV